MANTLFQKALVKQRQNVPPIWFMRQAGRYHYHYKNLKEKYTFEQLCKNPELAAEVAFGPINEFDFDVAILFSDILFILEALGLELKFDPGPKFDSYISTENFKDYNNIEKAIEHLKFQSDAIKLTKEKKYFYWMSSTAFKYTIKKYPELKEKYHYCGPGNSYNEIYSIFGHDKNLFVELSYDSWKKKLLNI